MEEVPRILGVCDWMELKSEMMRKRKMMRTRRQELIVSEERKRTVGKKNRRRVQGIWSRPSTATVMVTSDGVTEERVAFNVTA